MSGKTAHMLRKSATDRNIGYKGSGMKNLKKWWYGLTRAERIKARINMAEFHVAAKNYKKGK